MGEVFLQRAHTDLSSANGRERRGKAGLEYVLLLLLSHPSNHTTLPPLATAQRSTVVPQALTRNIPHSHCLVQTGRHHQVLGGVELGAHHVMIMSGQHTVDEGDIKKLFLQVSC